MKLRIAACLIAVTIFSCTHATEKTGAARQQAVSSKPTSTSAAAAPLQFGYADATGKRLRALDYQEQPDALTRAACSGAEMLTLRFTGKKEATEDNTGRDSASNFDAGGGFYYQIVNGKTTEDTICLLTDERFLAGKTAAQVTPGADKPEKKTVERIAQAKQRPVKEAWGLARIAPDKIFYLVLFERAGDGALFSVVMATPSRLVFLDFPGSYKDEGSVWRVDDGGEIDPLFFDIVLAFDSAQGVGFMYSWRGAEGDSVSFVQEAGGAFRAVKTSYKYMSPA